MIELMIDLQGGAKAPLYEKIYEHIKNEIVEGKLARGEKLPSTRLLAESLAVSRSTAVMAYEQLLAEGYIKAEPCRGFFVCDITGLYQLQHTEPQKNRKPENREQPHYTIDFSPYAIDTRSFPYNVWRKISRNVLLEDREELLLAGDGCGERELREAIARYLHQARGVKCQADNIVLGAGNEYLEILLTQILGDKKKILMENPGYPQAYRTFCNMGYEVKTVPAQSAGLSVEAVRGAGVRLVYVMPSHQFPLGSVMSLGQRLELLAWAGEEEGRYLIEDDHDSEYRYRGKPLPSLQSIDRLGKVIYLGTFSKSIAPSLRISYMVLPEKLMERCRKTCGFYSATVPRVQQEILNSFIREGHFERHLNKMRGIYRSRHDFLLGELKKRTWVRRVSGAHAGLHLLVEVETRLTEEALLAAAQEKGIGISGITQYILQGCMDAGERDACACRSEETQNRAPVLLLGYGKLDEEELCRGLLLLDEILGEKNISQNPECWL